MTGAHNTPDSRIETEPTTPEASPSAGWRETAALMHVAPGLGPAPARAYARAAPPDDGLEDTDETAPDADPDAARPTPAKDVLEVSS